MSEETKETVTNQDGENTGLELANFAGNVKTLTQEELDARKAKIRQLSNMKKADIKANSTNVSTRYWEAKQEGDSIQGMFIGWKVLQKKEDNEVKSLLTAVIETEKDGTYLNSGTMIVEAFQNVAEGSLVVVTYVKTEGRMKVYEVEVIDI